MGVSHTTAHRLERKGTGQPQAGWPEGHGPCITPYESDQLQRRGAAQVGLLASSLRITGDRVVADLNLLAALESRHPAQGPGLGGSRPGSTQAWLLANNAASSASFQPSHSCAQRQAVSIGPL